MSLFATNWAYADVAAFKRYLASSAHAVDFAAAEDANLLRYLETGSRRMEDKVQRVWQPRTETRTYDVPIRHRWSRFPEYDHENAGWRDDAETNWPPDYWPQWGHREVRLGDWLLTPSTVTAYSDTARTTSVVLTEGTGHDYVLAPYNDSAKTKLALLTTSPNGLSAGQQTLTIAGEWGWPYSLDLVTTLADSGGVDDTATTLTPADATSLAAGQTLRIEDESCYITAVVAHGVSPTTVTVRRGTCGTTAATHAQDTDISVVGYQSDLTLMCLEIARLRYHARDQGMTSLIGSGTDAVTTYPGQEENAILKRLDRMKGRALRVAF